jgi:hypothetical protein
VSYEKTGNSASRFAYFVDVFKDSSATPNVSLGPFYSMKTVNVYVDFMDELINAGFKGFKYLVRMERRKEV